MDLNLKKLRQHINNKAIIDVKNADEHYLAVSFVHNGENKTIYFTPELYSNEDVLAAEIKMKLDKIIHGRNVTFQDCGSPL